MNKRWKLLQIRNLQNIHLLIQHQLLIPKLKRTIIKYNFQLLKLIEIKPETHNLIKRDLIWQQNFRINLFIKMVTLQLIDVWQVMEMYNKINKIKILRRINNYNNRNYKWIAISVINILNNIKTIICIITNLQTRIRFILTPLMLTDNSSSNSFKILAIIGLKKSELAQGKIIVLVNWLESL